MAQEPEAGTMTAKRQIVVCMNKSMSALKTLSYNDAMKDCKEKAGMSTQAAIGKRSSLTADAANAPPLKTQ